MIPRDFEVEAPFFFFFIMEEIHFSGTSVCMQMILDVVFYMHCTWLIHFVLLMDIILNVWRENKMK